MNCTSCGRTNPAIARFCAGCGKPLAPRCPACGAEHEAEARFCIACGASVAARPTPGAEKAEARKVVTIVFADLIGSTALHERLDPESVSRVMERYHGAVRVPVEAHGGTVVQLLGDGVMCAFGVPRAGEDDAIRAVRAAVGIQRAFREFARAESDVVGTVGLRVAVNTGEVVVSDDYAAGIGDPLNVAARLQQEARDGDVLIGESTERLVRALVTVAPFGVFSLKGRAETVTAYRVVSLDRPVGAAATAFVGRDDELRRIRAVYDSAVATPAARLAVILGSPGLGKSRLLDEFARRLAGATVLTAQCEAAGGTTFAPIARAVRAVLGIDDATGGDDLRTALDAALAGDDADRGRIAAGIGALLAGTPASPEETFFVVRRFLAGLATTRPVMLAIDDLHWAEPLLLDLIEHLVQWSTGVPLLVLAAARPELRDTRSVLAATGRLVTDVVTLGGLDAGAATRLAANVIGADALPAAVAGRVLATSEGNPLFVGELVRMLVHDGALKREGERWTTGVELARLEMPPTIQALLAARIERLRPEERTVLERAAIVGRQFSRAAVTHLLPREITDLDARLEALRRSELIEPDAGWFLGEPVLRFHHVLIRDAAYRRVLKNTRAELHGRFADWLEARVGEAVEHDETIGWHLEQAHQHLRELGPLDAQGRALGERAARYLAAAGRRALGRDDLPPAASLLGRALDRLDVTDPARADLALDWCEALLAAGEVGPAARAIDELGRFTGDSERLRAWHTCFTGQLAALTDPASLCATADAVAAAAEALASAGDAAGEAKAHAVHASALARLGKVGACEAALDRALAAARRANDRRRSNAVLAGAPLAALWGPSPVTRASGRCLDVVRVLRITQGAPAVEAVALRCQGVLEALRGRTEAARRMIASSRRMVEELGIMHRLLEADVFAGLIELLERDAAAAERCLRAAYDGLRSHGLGIDAAQAAALLGRALLLQDRAAEAEALSHESEALAGDDLQAAIAWRGVRAEALARRGEHVSAIDFARTAVDLAAATDSLLYHADARLALAAALRAANRSDEAAGEETRAIELWEAKGATLLAERARREAGRVEPAALPPADSTLAARAPSRRVRANAATVYARRVDSAFADRNAEVLLGLLSDDWEMLDHPSGVAYDREAESSSYRALLSARDPTHRHEPLATLGGSLALCRLYVSARGYARGDLDVGAYQRERVSLIEVDAERRARRTESFAADKLGEAVVRLYERYAELLPDGPERDRAAATARAVATMLLPPDVDRLTEAFAPDIELLDGRPLGTWTARGAEAGLQHFRSLLALVDDIHFADQEILRLEPHALLVRRTHCGTARDGGGAYERRFLMLLAFGPDGLLTRIEWFDPEREAEALARFDELVLSAGAGLVLTPEPRRRIEGLTSAPVAAHIAAAPFQVAKKLERRVRLNAATADVARVDAAMAARDAGALRALLAELVEVVDHPGGVVYDREGLLATQRTIMSVEGTTMGSEPLATLGDSLALCRWSVSASGVARGKFDVGAYEQERIHLSEVDAQGRRRREEFFSPERLGDAIARLYERYAELLPDGPERDRAAATARSAATLMVRSGPDERYASMLAPAVEVVDHRILGTWSARGKEAVLEHLRAVLALADDVAFRDQEILGLRSDALLTRRTHSGTARAGGGVYERPFLILWVFGPDGLQVRGEYFDAHQDAEALARFDELALSSGEGLALSPEQRRRVEGRTAEPAAGRIAPAPPRVAKRRGRRVRPNAAAAILAGFDAAVAARDASAFAGLLADEYEAVDHTTGITYDRQGELVSYRALASARDPAHRVEPLATLGDALALCRTLVSASGFAGRTFDVGAYEREMLIVTEGDERGRLRRTEIFAVDRLGDAVVRLYERYADLLPDGPARTRAAATARSVAAVVGPFDVDRLATAFAPAVESVDHRILGTWVARGAEALLQHYRSVLELADDVAIRNDEVLGLRSDALLLRRTHIGTARAGGGAYERQYLALSGFGTDGLQTLNELFDCDREDEALARFDDLVLSTGEGLALSAEQRRRVEGLTATPAAPCVENAATRLLDRVRDAWAARDWGRFASLFAPGFRVIERRKMLRLEVDRDPWFAAFRPFIEMTSSIHIEVLATRGDRIALSRGAWMGSGGDIGPSEVAWLTITETDDCGEAAAVVAFDPEDLDAAYAELDHRYAAGEVAAHGQVTVAMAAFVRAIAARDWDAMSALLSPDLVVTDHRPLGWETLHGPATYVESLKSLVDLAPDVRLRNDHMSLSGRAALFVNTLVGTREGGAFEAPRAVVFAFDADGRIRSMDFYDPEQLAEARARFEELRPHPARARSSV